MNENLRIIQYVGATYLVYTGVTMWLSDPQIQPRAMKGGLMRLFVTGFLLNISNPKVPIFYLALPPGVLGIKPLTLVDTITLLGLIAVIEVVVIGGHVFVGYKAKGALSNAARVKVLTRSAGALMVGAGVLVAAR